MAAAGAARARARNQFLTAGAWVCVPPLALYFECVFWAAGMLMGAPISMSPAQGPYPRYFSRSAEAVGGSASEEHANVRRNGEVGIAEGLTLA